MITKITNQIKDTFGLNLFNHGKNFTKYLIIGLIWTIFNVFFMWLFIDKLGFATIIGSSIVAFFLFFGKYCAYLIIHLIKSDFWKYFTSSIAFVIATPVLMWILVDLMQIPTVLSSLIITLGLFILRFLSFYFLGIMKEA